MRYRFRQDFAINMAILITPDFFQCVVKGREPDDIGPPPPRAKLWLAERRAHRHFVGKLGRLSPDGVVPSFLLPQREVGEMRDDYLNRVARALNRKANRLIGIGMRLLTSLRVADPSALPEGLRQPEKVHLVGADRYGERGPVRGPKPFATWPAVGLNRELKASFTADESGEVVSESSSIDVAREWRNDRLSSSHDVSLPERVRCGQGPGHVRAWPWARFILSPARRFRKLVY